MKFNELTENISSPVFSIKSVYKLFPHTSKKDISKQLSRYVRKGRLERVANGIYKLPQKTIVFDSLSSLLYYPCYISLETVLSRHGVLFTKDAEKYHRVITLVTPHRSNHREIYNYHYQCSRIRSDLYFGYEEKFCEFNQISYYEATLEKAVADFLYLRKDTDPSCIDLSFTKEKDFDLKKFESYAGKYPDWLAVSEVT